MRLGLIYRGILLAGLAVVLAMVSGCGDTPAVPTPVTDATGAAATFTALVPTTVTGADVTQVAQDWAAGALTFPYQKDSLRFVTVRQDADFATVDVHVQMRPRADATYAEYVARVELAKVGDHWQVTQPGYFTALTDFATRTAEVARPTLTAVAIATQQLQNASLRAIQMLSPTDGWIVGDFGKILRYQGGRWTAVDSPTAEFLKTLSLTTAGTGWAGGGNNTLLRYQGDQWTAVAAPVGMVAGLATVSADDAWAINTGCQMYHYQAGQWTLAYTPDFFLQQDDAGIEMLSSAEGWAICGKAGIVLHYQAGKWTAERYQKATALSNAILYSRLSLVSPTEGWAAGSDPIYPFLHYQGGHWIQVAGPADLEKAGFPHLTGISMVAPDEGWAVGATTMGLLLHYHQGQWTVVPSPTQQWLSGVSMVSATEGWAVGNNNTILHYQAGTWRTYAP